MEPYRRRAAYVRYMQSPAWEKQRQAALKRAKHACQRCGTRKKRLEVHHLTYERFGHERSTDLLVVCHACHEEADEERRDEQRDARWAARMDGWATKVYGVDWEECIDWYVVEARFEAWLEKKGYDDD